VKRFIIIAGLTLLIIQNAYGDSLSVSCNSSAGGWIDVANACGDDGNSAIISGTGNTSYTLAWSITDPSIASAQVIDSIQVYIKGADANGSTLTIWLANYDDVAAPLSGAIHMVWDGTAEYRSYGGHGDWNNGGTVTGQNLADGQYVFVIIPEDGYDYSTNNLTVDNMWMRFWWPAATASGNPRRRNLLTGDR
jgi:hypothetical protein